MTALSNTDGSIGAGAEGIYADDVRIVSRLTVDLDGGLSQVASASSGNASEFLSSARALGDKGPDPSVEVHRRRVLDHPTATERVTVRSRAAVLVTARLTITIASDGRDIAEVKHGLPSGAPLPMTGTADTVEWEASRHVASGRFTPTPSMLRIDADGAVASFDISLQPGAEQVIDLIITTRRSAPSLLDADAGSSALAFTSSVRITGTDPRLEQAVNVALSDVEHLAMTDPLASTDVFLAAGSPWYLTLFGRDSVWSARMLLPLSTELAAGTLRTLARRQGTKTDPSTAEQPGKIPHELRRSAGTTGGHPLPPVYYGTVDATALWVTLLAETLEWSGDESLLAELEPALLAALTWLTQYAAPDADGLIKYIDASGTGLVNQGWKDSGDSIRYRDGHIADAPIALIEAQAYAVEALTAGATLLRRSSAADHDDRAAECERRAAELTRSVRERFWVSDGQARWPAIAVDGSGQPVSGIASNMGHCLGTGVFDADETDSVATTLLSPNMFGQYGIRTFADDNGGFNPIGYHTGSIWIHDTAICALGLAKSHKHDHASRVAAAMMNASASFQFRTPELHGDHGVLGRPVPYPASCRPQAWSAASTVAMVSAALGLHCDGGGRRLVVGNARPVFGAVLIEGLQVAGHRVALTVSDGSATATGLPDGWSVEVS